ncbi:MAG: hypothetical protein HOO91_02950 [Bacteroidales bacterium]|nr:hypothetical protein [Bacteroidales bacterium]
MIHTVTAMGSIVTKFLSSGSVENCSEGLDKFLAKYRLIGLKDDKLKIEYTWM